jgi:hypothetical protein
MEDGIDISESLFNSRLVADVPDDKFCVGTQITRTCFVAMDLWREIIVKTNGIAPGKQTVGDV